MNKFQSIKVYDGFSTCFRQWRAEGTHCKYLHGYGTSIRITFQGNLDERNWVYDFGGFKRSKETIDGKSPDQWLKWLLDHTTIIAENDPELDTFRTLDRSGIIQLRVLPDVGAERFAEFIYNKLNPLIKKETEDRVEIYSVEFKEHDKNSAIYIKNN